VPPVPGVGVVLELEQPRPTIPHPKPAESTVAASMFRRRVNIARDPFSAEGATLGRSPLHMILGFSARTY
jgi:hypothetical protein